MRWPLLSVLAIGLPGTRAEACTPARDARDAAVIVGRVAVVEPPVPTVDYTQVDFDGHVTHQGSSTWEGTVTLRAERTQRWRGPLPPRNLMARFSWAEAIEGCPSGVHPPADEERHSFLVRQDARTGDYWLIQVGDAP